MAGWSSSWTSQYPEVLNFIVGQRSPSQISSLQSVCPEQHIQGLLCLTQFSQLYTLGQTILTETGRDNRSPGFLLPTTFSLHAPIVHQCGSLKMSRFHYSVRQTVKKKSLQLFLCTGVTVCNKISLIGVSSTTQLALKAETARSKPHCATSCHLPVPIKW